MGSRVLAISDLQAPYQHPDALPFACAVREKHKTDKVVVIGDEIDCHALTDFVPDPDGYSAGHELDAALRFLERLYAEFPAAKVCESNHPERIKRRRKKAGIPSAMMRELRQILQAPRGWVWGKQWVVDDVLYEHGNSIGGASHTAAQRMVLKNGMSTVFGHRHSGGGVIYLGNPRGRMFGLNVGCLIDITASAFDYVKRPELITLGCGVVADDVAQFIPMITDSRGRWRGRL